MRKAKVDGKRLPRIILVIASFRNHAEELEGFVWGCLKLVLLVWWNEDRIAGSDLFFSVFVPNPTAPIQNKDLMLPVVAVERSEPARINCEVAH